MNLNKHIFLTISFLLMTVPYALGHVTGANLQNFQYNAETRCSRAYCRWLS